MNKAISIFLCTVVLFATARAQEGLLYETPIKLPAEVNSDAEEAAVLVSPDGSTLYFSRIMFKGNTGGVKGGQDIWSSASDGNGSWYLAEHNLLELNNKGNNAIIGVSSDGNTLYLLNKYKGSKTSMGISKSRRDGGQWSEPEALDIPGLITNSDYYGFNMDVTGSFLIISMNSKSSLGQEDLYVSKNEGGTWSSPIHLGNVINSVGFEITPFLTTDTKTIYFSTNARGGFGNADIYKSDRLDDTWTNWSEPENMGDKINSAGFDAFFSITKSNQIFFCSNRSGMLSDIFHTKVLERLVIGDKIEGQELVGVVPDAVEESLAMEEPTEVEISEEVVPELIVAEEEVQEEETNVEIVNEEVESENVVVEESIAVEEPVNEETTEETIPELVIAEEEVQVEESNEELIAERNTGEETEPVSEETTEEPSIEAEVTSEEEVSSADPIVSESTETEEVAVEETEPVIEVSTEEAVPELIIAEEEGSVEEANTEEETTESVSEAPSGEPEVSTEEEVVSTDPIAPDSNQDESTETSEATEDLVVTETESVSDETTEEPIPELVVTEEEEPVEASNTEEESNEELIAERNTGEETESVSEETTEEPSTEAEVTSEEEVASTDPTMSESTEVSEETEALVVEETETVIEEATEEPSSESEVVNEEEVVTTTDPIAMESTETSEETEEVVVENVASEEETPVFDVPSLEVEPIASEPDPILEAEPVVEEVVSEPVRNDDPIVSDVSVRREVADAGQVYFDLNSSYFSEAEAEKLQLIYEKLGSQPALKLEVLGYSDNIGEEFYNMWISARRADRIVQYLVEKGIDAGRLSSKWFGEANQAASCVECSEEQHQENRRVELILQ